MTESIADKWHDILETPPPKLTWNLEEAVELCRLVELICPDFGCHVALTGGSLYKEGERKDCDLLFYRIRQVKKIDRDGLFAALAEVGIEKYKGRDWVYKAMYNDKMLDLFFPESEKDETQAQLDAEEYEKQRIETERLKQEAKLQHDDGY